MMFKGLHSTLQKAKTLEAAPKHPDVTVIQTADVLLSSEKRQQHLKTIKALLNLPPKLYDNLYLKVLKQFAEFTQNLPNTQYGLFANEGGFLDNGLERASRALSLCLSYFFPQEKTFQAISPQEALWVYAVFTAALLLDIGKIAVKYDIDLCNKDGSLVKEWLPYSGPMTKHGKFYRFSFIKRNLDNLQRLITGLLARQVLDQATTADEAGGSTAGGFNWIASNQDVLETWLTILQGERRLPMTSFMSVIPIADAQIIESYLANRPLSSTQPQTVNEALPVTATEAGENFLKWLRENIANEKISINAADSAIHVVEEGVLIDAANLIEKFIQENKANFPQNMLPDSVEKQFRQLLEVHFDSPATLRTRYALIQGISTQQPRYLMVNPALVFIPGSPQAQAAAQLSMHLQKLPSQELPNLPQQPMTQETTMDQKLRYNLL